MKERQKCWIERNSQGKFGKENRRNKLGRLKNRNVILRKTMVLYMNNKKEINREG